MKRLAIGLIAAITLISGCFRPEFRTITVSVPQMKSEACADRIVAACKRMDGVSNVVADLNKKTVDVTYKTLNIGIKNVDFAIAEAGFDADDVKATEEARKALPADCK